MNKINKFAVVFPGQGSQSLGMLSDFYETYEEVRDIYSEASAVLGYDLWNITKNGPAEKLNITEFTQPALLAACYAIWQVFCKNTDLRPQVLAGHSLGEYTALVAAESLNFNDAIKLVAARGKFMQEAVPRDTGAMAAVLGLEDDIINNIVAEFKVEIANLNAIGQTVIAGHKQAVILAIDSLKQKGAKLVKLLDVSVPSHCSLMQPAAEKLSYLFDTVHIKPPKIKVIHNYSLNSYNTECEIKSALVKQLTMPVRWVETIQQISSMDIKLVCEFGPGAVLSKLTKRIDTTVTGISIDTPSAVFNLINYST